MLDERLKTYRIGILKRAIADSKARIKSSDDLKYLSDQEQKRREWQSELDELEKEVESSDESPAEIEFRSWRDLPDDLDFFSFDKWPKGWSYGAFDSDHAYVIHIRPDGSEVRYQIPQTILSIMRRERRNGADELRSEFRRLLDIDDQEE